MGTLDRYRKPGGFKQLVFLIETFDPKKQEKFISLVEEESLLWARAVREKILTIDRILGWPDEIVSEIAKRLPTKTLACAVLGFKPEQTEKILSRMSHAEKRRIDDEKGQLQNNAGEISSAHSKLIELARQMCRDGEVRLEKIDESLIIEDGIEEALKDGGGASVQVEVKATGDGDVIQLRKSLVQTQKENQALKAENKVLKEKLEQIRKIA